ncbi:MAG TPA: histidine phosphatase family protein [Candidatus Limnocylindria bacterium]|nr:histidine phosphatase family protein [Candidatus Limnocylindria bacterium]
MGSIVLVRHATTADSLAGTNLGQRRDPRLTADGRLLAERLGRAITLELAELDQTELRLISSPARRCLDTAAAILVALPASARPEVQVEAGLREIDYGTWEGLSEEECRRRDPELRAAWEADPFATAAPGGESGGDVAARAFPVLETIQDWLAADRSSAAVVVSHNHVLRLRLAVLIGFATADYRRRLVVEPGSYSIVTIASARRTIRRVGVLPPAG